MSTDTRGVPCPCNDDSPDHQAFVRMFDVAYGDPTGPRSHETVRMLWHVLVFRYQRLMSYELSDTLAAGLLWCARLKGVPETVAFLLGWAEAETSEALLHAVWMWLQNEQHPGVQKVVSELNDLYAPAGRPSTVQFVIPLGSMFPDSK